MCWETGTHGSLRGSFREEGSISSLRRGGATLIIVSFYQSILIDMDGDTIIFHRIAYLIDNYSNDLIGTLLINYTDVGLSGVSESNEVRGISTSGKPETRHGSKRVVNRAGLKLRVRRAQANQYFKTSPMATAILPSIAGRITTGRYLDVEYFQAICFSILVQLKSYLYRSPLEFKGGGPSGIALKLGTPDQDVGCTFTTTDAEDITPIRSNILSRALSLTGSSTLSPQGCPTAKERSDQHGGKIREKAKVRGNSLNTQNSLWLFAIRKFSTNSLTYSRDVLEHMKESDPLAFS